MTNFDLFAKVQDFASFTEPAVSAERIYQIDTAACVLNCRRAMEAAVKWMYSVDSALVMPYQDNLVSLITERPFVKTRKRKRSEWLLSLAVHSFDLRIGLKRHPRYTPAPVSDRQEPDAGGRHCNSQYTPQPRAAGLSHPRNL